MYRIESLVGEGGMGQVYRAVDTRLDRTVAIKVLPTHLSSHPELRERFEREAKTISSLSHPNVCALYDVGSHDGLDYLVMEYVDGETLADRLARGPLTLEQAVRYGVEIAEALHAAHRRGITHRDLKPGNVMVNPNGAKLLDFGLARTAAATITGPDAATEQQKPLTAEGALLGTFQYMAPEQLEGLPVDARTDIFALGAVLYEMVTGRRAFEGGSRASLIASILDREPAPISSFTATTPASLDRVVRTCLAKDPEQRFQSARDVALQLRWVARAEEESRPGRGGRGVWPWIAAAALALVLFTGAAWMAGRSNALERLPVHLSLLPPPGFELGDASIAPDGTIAFTAASGGKRYLFVRALHDPQARQLAEVITTAPPFWSPDSRWVGYFHSGAHLMKVPVAGGTPEQITGASYGFGATWAEDGNIIFTPAFYQPLHIVPAGGGEARPLTKLDAARGDVTHGHPVALPGGKGVLFLAIEAASTRIMHLRSYDSEPVEVMKADALIGYSEPHLLFARNGDIYSIDLDLDTSRVTGQAVRVVENVLYRQSDSTAAARVNNSGMLIYEPRIPEMRRLVWYDRRGQNRGVLLEDEDITSPRLSPDGSRLLLTKFQPKIGEFGIYRVDLQRGIRTFVTPAPRFGFNAVWLTDGERFAFTSSETTADYNLFLQVDDPLARPTLLWGEQSDDKEALAAAPDGSWLLVREFRQQSGYDLWMVPLHDSSKRRLIVGGPSHEHDGDISPDGRWIAYASDASGTMQTYVMRVEGGRSVQVSTTFGTGPRWSRDGNEIFYLDNDRTVVASSFRDGPTPVIGAPERLFRLPDAADLRFELGVDRPDFIVAESSGGHSAGSHYNVVSGWQRQIE